MVGMDDNEDADTASAEDDDDIGHSPTRCSTLPQRTRAVIWILSSDAL